MIEFVILRYHDLLAINNLRGPILLRKMTRSSTSSKSAVTYFCLDHATNWKALDSLN